MISMEIFYSSEEEDKLHLPKIRRSLRDNSNPFDLNEQIFIKYFRLNKSAFQHVLDEISGKLKINVRQRAVPNILNFKQTFAAVLKFFAHGSYQTSVGNDFNVGLAQSTVSETFKEVFNALESILLSKWISMQYTDEDHRNAIRYFYENCGIPNITGCVDGTHIRIIGPKKEIRHLYYNRKGFHSVNAMIVCDHLMRIRFINAKNPGATHDATVWNMSFLRDKIHEDYCNHTNNVVLLGDSGYALTPYLLTPYRNSEEGSLQARFNKKHAKGRNIVERTIGLLKSRFRCLFSAMELHYTPKKVTQITNICAALHNICLKYNVNIPEEQENDNVEDVDISDEVEIQTNSSNLFNEGSRIRDRIANLM